MNTPATNEREPLDFGLGRYRFGVYFGFSNSLVWMIGAGTPMVLMAEHLGASAAQVGLFYSAILLLLPVQVLGSRLLPVLGYQRQIVVAWSLRTLCLVPPIGLAWFSWEGGGNGPLIIFGISLYLFCFFRALGYASFVPWIFSIVPESLRGRYFGTDAMLVGIAGIGILLVSSGIFAVFSIDHAFILVYSLAAFGALVSIFFLTRLPDGERPALISLKSMFVRAPQLLATPGPYRVNLLLQIAFGAITYAFIPYTVYYLRTSLGFDQSYLLILTALQYSGTSLAAIFIRQVIDRWGPRPFFLIAQVVSGVFVSIGLGLIVVGPSWEFLMPVLFLLIGVASACFYTATNKRLPTICETREIHLSSSLFVATAGFVGGLVATGLGFVLKDPASGLINPSHFTIFLVVALIGHAVLFFFFLLLGDKDGKDTPYSGFWVRPARSFVSALYPGKRRQEKGGWDESPTTSDERR